MPDMHMLIHQLGTTRYLYTLELTKGYWQIPLDKEAKEKTVFATPSGLYHFTKMPFGLHGAAASFQQLTDRALKAI